MKTNIESTNQIIHIDMKTDGAQRNSEPSEQLLKACYGDHVEKVKKILIKHPNLLNESLNGDGHTLLIYACRHNLINIVQYLFTSSAGGIDVNKQDKDGWTALHWASYCGNTKPVELLLKNSNINIEIRNKEGRNAKDLAIQEMQSHITTRIQKYENRNLPPSESEVSSNVNPVATAIEKRESDKTIKEIKTDDDVKEPSAKPTTSKSTIESAVAKEQPPKATDIKAEIIKPDDVKEPSAKPTTSKSTIESAVAKEQPPKATDIKAEIIKPDDVKEPSAKPTTSKSTIESTVAKEQPPKAVDIKAEIIKPDEVKTSDAKSSLFSDDAYMQGALAQGKKEWGRSKIMIVGEGRAGKTALANSILGRKYENTDSTVGINEFTCNVGYAEVSGNQDNREGVWAEFKDHKQKKEYETALATLISDKEAGRIRRKKKVNPSEKKEELEELMKGINKGGGYMEAERGEFKKKPKIEDREKISKLRNIKIGDGTENQFEKEFHQTIDKEVKLAVVELEKASSKPVELMVKLEEKETLKPKDLESSNSRVDREKVLSSDKSTKGNETSVEKNLNQAITEQVRESPDKRKEKEKQKEAPIDKSLVMQYLGEKKSVESKFIISVFDFGGQSVFNVIHPFFLTRLGVYVLVFNMEWLSSDAAKEVREDCISYMTFWLNSIIIHTQNEKQEIAPIFIVGTRKDVVSSPAEHLKISTAIYQLFSSSLAWPYTVENDGAEGPNGKVDLCFYPINNTLSNRDSTVVKLLKKIEETIDGSSYVHAERPLSWFQVLDALKKQNLPFLQYEKVNKIVTEDCLIPSDKAPLLVKFFHEMGILMWHDEDTLRDVVVFDPIEYFVKPATTIICKHVPDEMDGIRHVLEIHRTVRKLYAKEFQQMTTHGIVTEKLLKALLQAHEQNYVYIRQMMLKYGLLVPLTLQQTIGEEEYIEGRKGGVSRGEEEDEEGEKLYLAPALLPESKLSLSLTEGSISTQFYFIFTPSKGLGQMTTISLEDCSSVGFLPQGLFEKLVSKALMWSMKTSDFVSRSTLYGCYKNAAELAFGNQTFRVYADSRHNLISVVVDGANPVGIHDRLRDQLQEIISESLKSLKFVTVLRYESVAHGASDHSSGAKAKTTSSEKDILFLRLSQIRSLVEKKTALSLNVSGGRSLLNVQDAMSLYGPWLVDFTSFEEYDLFLSYRWGQRDSEFTSALFDRMSLYSVEQSMRSIRTFLDNKRLEVGENFQYGFIKALASSLIMIPIVSYDALLRMTNLQAEEEDNVLIEWICGIEFVKYQSIMGNVNRSIQSTDTALSGKAVRLQKIMPVFFGSSPEEGVIRNLFQEKIIDRLPTISPMACLSRAKELLEGNGITVSGDFGKATIKGIVQEITKFLFLCAWEINNKKHITAHAAEKIVPILNEELIHEQRKLQEIARAKATAAAALAVATTNALDSKGNTSPSKFTALGSGNPVASTELSLNQMKDMIKKDCEIASNNTQEIIKEALANLSEEEQDQVNHCKTTKEKLLMIVQLLGLSPS